MEPAGNELSRRQWVLAGYIKKGVRIFLAFSVAVFVLYLAGSMPDLGLSDRVLFFLLRMLRYSSLLLCAFSVFALGFSVNTMVHVPRPRNVVSLLFYFCAGILGAAFAMLDSLIIAASEGNI